MFQRILLGVTVERIIEHPVERTVEKTVERMVEKTVQQLLTVAVPVERTVEIEVPVESVLCKDMPVRKRQMRHDVGGEEVGEVDLILTQHLVVPSQQRTQENYSAPLQLVVQEHRRLAIGRGSGATPVSV